MINVDLLTRKYGDFMAVNAVSFSIEKGEIVGLLGHNGAGKTTIMKMLTGYLEPSSGTIKIDGMDMLDQRESIQRKIGYLPENCPLYPEMTVMDYLHYVAKLKSIPDVQVARAVQLAISRTELMPKALNKIETLSRGYRQRVGVAQAILGNPQILILDEPTNGLDPSQIQQMRKLIKDLAQSCTVIVSTHILQEVQAICDRVLIIRGGCLVLDSHLNTLQRSRRLMLAMDCSPEHAHLILEKVQGSERIEYLYQDGQRHFYAIEYEMKNDHSAYEDFAPHLAQKILERGHRLFSIYPEKRDLETVFREINNPSQGGGEYAA